MKEIKLKETNGGYLVKYAHPDAGVFAWREYVFTTLYEALNKIHELMLGGK